MIDLLLCLLAAPLLVATGYLFVLSVVSRRRPAPPAPSPSVFFDVVIPAHDEELGIGRTVANVLGVDYPRELFRVLVVADNCTDATAQKAREAGAAVLERVDLERRGKGYALARAFEKSLGEGRARAVVVVDADTVVSRNLLGAFSARLEAGAHAVQAHYGVLNPTASWRTRLMTIALAMFHILRSLGRERLGVSCGLRGNGMCFSAAVLREVPHEAFSIVEDLEYGIRLGEAGHRVVYAEEAHVLGEMVSGEKASRSQRRRWEQGRLAIARQHGPSLLRRFAATRRGLFLDLALDVLVPPLTWVAFGALAGSALAFGVGGQLPRALFAAADVFLLTYVLKGWWLSGTGARGLLDLACAPLYMMWKLTLLLRRSAHRKNEWVRTAREGESP